MNSAEFAHYLQARYGALWVRTAEPARAEYTLSETVPEGRRFRYDVREGIQDLDTGAKVEGRRSPLDVFAWLQGQSETTLFWWNLHRIVDSLEVIQSIQNIGPWLKDSGNHLVALAPAADRIPPELARIFTLVDFRLPTVGDLRDILTQTMPQLGEYPTELIDAAMEACRGLTVNEAEDAVALSLVRSRTLDPAIIAQVKTEQLMRQTMLVVQQWPDRFENLGGLDVIKDYLPKAAPSDLSLGSLLLGPPGTGKSTIAKALGNELGWPTVALDFGRMMGSLVGQSEQRMREALDAIDALGRCVVFIDEIEKGLSGTQSSGQTDSGVKAGVASTFLKWMSDRPKGQAYIIATCNNIAQLPPEYTRSERWDALWFIDIPNREERAAIWDIYLGRYKVTGARDLVNDDEWTGAEVQTCCRQATMLNIPIEQAQSFVTPVVKTQAEQIQALRDWSNGRTVAASTPENTAIRNGYKRVRKVQ